MEVAKCQGHATTSLEGDNMPLGSVIPGRRDVEAGSESLPLVVGHRSELLETDRPEDIPESCPAAPVLTGVVGPALGRKVLVTLSVDLLLVVRASRGGSRFEKCTRRRRRRRSCCCTSRCVLVLYPDVGTAAWSIRQVCGLVLTTLE